MGCEVLIVDSFVEGLKPWPQHIQALLDREGFPGPANVTVAELGGLEMEPLLCG